MVENDVQVAMKRAKSLVGLDEEARIYCHLLNPGEASDYNESSAFLALMDTVFGFGLCKMLEETSGLEGRTMKSVDLHPEEHVDIAFHF